ncbi:hypothetical protein ACQR1Y_33940 [Bradyrhizobium sp. HKCCYLRH3099]|uniref:hypothetical protein n=1 Tax=unclassified Bradyrhizobium TaxID=2631580 RepID=UPI003EC10FEA
MMRKRTAFGASPARSGIGTFDSFYMEYDLENGVNVTPASGPTSPYADFAWSSAIAWVLAPVNNAGICPLGMASYETLDRRSLLQLVYNAERTQDWRPGSVFAMRTRSGLYTKVQILSNGSDFRWQTYDEPRFLNVKIVLGSAPRSLVSRYVAECTYQSPYGRVTCCQGAMGPEGGVLEGRVSDDSVAFPNEVTITIAVDFTPESTLSGITKTVAQPVTETGVSFLFEPNQVLQVTGLVLDLRPTPLSADYLAVRWKHRGAGGVVASGLKTLAGADLAADAVTQYNIIFQPDPIRADNVELEILGRLQGADIVRFSASYALPEPAILLKATWNEAASAYSLISQFDDRAESDMMPMRLHDAVVR